MKGEHMENEKKIAGYVYITPDTYADVLVSGIRLDTLFRVIADAWVETADKTWMPEPPETVTALMRVWEPALYVETRKQVDEIKAKRAAEVLADAVQNDG